MFYYNIHTHVSNDNPSGVELVSIVIKDPLEKSNAPYRSYGIHPWYIYNVAEQKKQLRHYVLLPETVAIGEAGLDQETDTDLALQEELFRWQIELSEELHKPLIIHCVKAWAALITLRKEYNPRQPWIVHGFRGKPELARQLIRQGIHLSFGARFNAAALREAWPDHVLAETDEREMPISAIYQEIADSLALPLEVVAMKLAENTTSIFCFFK